MALEYRDEWKFASVDEIPAIPPMLARAFANTLVQIAASDPNEVGFVEAFKTTFGGKTRSTSLEWARHDLETLVCDKERNAVLLIEQLYECLQLAKAAGLKIPSVAQVNAMLRRNGVGYELRPPQLVEATADAVVVSGDTDGWASSDRYQLGELLGKGGYGQVFAATRETAAGTFEYALKLLDPHPFISDRDKAAERFRREVEAHKRLQHRGIVPYLDAGFDNRRRPYVVMPKIDGRNIRDYAEGQPAVSCIRLMLEVLSALSYAHGQSILHRDLKPANIRVRESDGQPIILDFGNAFIIDELDWHSLTTTQVGSIGYIPPEVTADPRQRSPLQDIFACAVITYELIARRQPNHQAYEPLSRNHEVPIGLDAVLQAALGRAESRPQTAAIFHQLLARECGL